MPLSENVIEKLLQFFSIPDSKARFEFGIGITHSIDIDSEESESLLRAMGTAAAITVPKRTVINALVEQALSARYNAEGLTDEEMEKVGFILAIVFAANDEELAVLSDRINPIIRQVHDVYEMYADTAELIGE